MNLLSDPGYLTLFHSGDKKIFERVFHAFENGVYRMAWQMLQHSGEAEDIVAEMRFKLWNAKEKFRDEEHVKAFLLRATRNRCLDILKKRRRSPIAPGGYDHLPVMQDTDGGRDVFRDKVEERVYRLVLTAVLEEMKDMPERCREVAHLRLIEGLSIKEVADVMGIKESTVHAQWLKARKLLRAALRKREFLPMISLAVFCQPFF